MRLSLEARHAGSLLGLACGDAVLAAANLGDDADTTAAIAGQLAGAHYRVGAIPRDWLATLHRAEHIAVTAGALCRARAAT